MLEKLAMQLLPNLHIKGGPVKVAFRENSANLENGKRL